MTENKKPKFFYGYFVVLAAFLTLVITWGTMYSFGVFFKPLLTEFGWTRAMTSGAYSLYYLLHGFFYIFTGRLNDRFGPRIIVTACGLFLGLGYLLMSQISAIWHLYLFYGVVIAIGMGGSIPLISTVARWFVKRRGLMTGIAVSAAGFGTLIIPPLASWLIATYDWRTSYTIIGIIALVLIVLAAWFLRRDPSQVGQVPYGEEEVKAESLDAKAGGFSLREALRTSQFWLLCTIYSCFNFCMQAVMVHIAPHTTDLGISAISAANVLAIIGGTSIAGKIITGGAGDRIGNKTATILCLVLLSISLFWLQLANTVWMLYLFAALFGFAYGGVLSPQSPLIAALFGLSSHGVIFGVIFFASTIGGAIGPLLAGHIFDITSSYQLAFLTCGAIAIIAIILTSLLRPTR